MTSVQRGFIWITLMAAIIFTVTAFAASNLWRASTSEQIKSARYQHLSDNREAALRELEEIQHRATVLRRGYIRAASAAQAEALLREEVSLRISEAGGELASIQTQPAERGDPDGILRLRVVLTTPQPLLGPVLSRFADEEPTIIIEGSEIKIANGIRRPGSVSSETEKKPLNLSLNIAAFWKEPVANG